MWRADSIHGTVIGRLGANQPHGCVVYDFLAVDFSRQACRTQLFCRSMCNIQDPSVHTAAVLCMNEKIRSNLKRIDGLGAIVDES